MFKSYILFLFYLFVNLNIPNLLAEKNEGIIESNSIKKLDWEYSNFNTEEPLNWYENDTDEIYKEQIKIKKKLEKLVPSP